MILVHPLPALSVNAISITKDIFTILAVLLAGAWFLGKWQFGRRATITLDCSFFEMEAGNTILAEVAIGLKNVGDVRQDLFGFDLSIASIEEAVSGTNERSRLVEFTRVLIPETVFHVPDGALRPGVERLYTFPFVLRSPGTMVQIAAAIRYSEQKPAINKVLRVFPLQHASIERPGCQKST